MDINTLFYFVVGFSAFITLVYLFNIITKVDAKLYELEKKINTLIATVESYKSTKKK